MKYSYKKDGQKKYHIHAKSMEERNIYYWLHCYRQFSSMTTSTQCTLSFGENPQGYFENAMSQN